jgi:hypothetical protein
VFGVLLAPLAELLHDKTIGDQFLVLAGVIVHVLADGAFKRNHLVLRHIRE